MVLVWWNVQDRRRWITDIPPMIAAWAPEGSQPKPTPCFRKRIDRATEPRCSRFIGKTAPGELYREGVIVLVALERQPLTKVRSPSQEGPGEAPDVAAAVAMKVGGYFGEPGKEQLTRWLAELLPHVVKTASNTGDHLRAAAQDAAAREGARHP